ncbi:hypothetical protein B0I35DRAFT_492983 [Stachybotrys elegans]|uniref:SGNH hydrolase-type esterase domain-containing protein n=1 Tax=Stachybotrys elegans TaxID=80388 RepID=A0A8K0SGD3_9HYPO|nr:hypothetical protein B0I35DRAFT_492983 [Stachybotrys elegans]
MRSLSLSLLALAATLSPVHATRRWRDKVSHAVFFGDSFTDQSRSHSIDNGTYPGRYYETIYPPDDPAANGRVAWPRYFGLQTGLPYENYAVGGAVCSHELTPGFTVPAVSGGQLAWFVQYHVLANATHNQPPKLDIRGSETLAIVWIGTNDLGAHSLLAPNPREGSSFWPNAPPLSPAVPPIAPGNDNATTMLDLVDCQLGSLWKLWDYGVRNFLVLSTIPLHLTPLYSITDEPTIYWPEPHDGASWHRQMFQNANSLNDLMRVSIRDAQKEMSRKGGRIEFFDTYKFFQELYISPQNYFNGTAPVNVTGHCRQCPNATWTMCGIGDCTWEERDSFMWWDELHPSEQTGRLLAKEIAKKLDGTSVY